MAYIDKAKAIQSLTDFKENHLSIPKACLMMIDTCITLIKIIPTADVVEVVRCEKCKRRVDYEGKIMCNKFGHKFQGEWYGLKAITKDHFCSYGQRKE